MNGTPGAGLSPWGPFGRPLFADPKARALARVGVVDVGSNSVRLVVFDGAARSPAYFYNEKIMCGLGAGMAETGRLNPEGRERALAAMRRFQLLSEGMDLPGLTCVATAAVREAEDGQSFIDTVKEQTGLDIWVIDGEEEARLSAQGVLLGWPGAYGLICDIGGSSMELAEIHDGQVGKRVTSPLGPLKLTGFDPGSAALDKHIEKIVASISSQLGPQNDRLFLVGGSWRAIARIDMDRRNYPLHVLHEYRMTAEAVEETAKYIAAQNLNELRGRCGISASRMALVPYAIRVLTQVVSTFQPVDIAVSAYGIREGLLYEQMPQEIRDRDPLIEACRFAEAKDARMPGFGRTLFNFVLPLFPDVPDERMRIIKAACLLHDVSWRAHPDYRAQNCFENATRANLGGLTHQERVYMGLSLLHRYRNKREGTNFEELYCLLDEEAATEAEVLGKAMRLGAMLWMSKSTQGGVELRWHPDKRLLQIAMSAGAKPLFGEVAQSRFKSLANAMNAEHEAVDL